MCVKEQGIDRSILTGGINENELYQLALEEKSIPKINLGERASMTI